MQKNADLPSMILSVDKSPCLDLSTLLPQLIPTFLLVTMKGKTVGWRGQRIEHVRGKRNITHDDKLKQQR